MFDSNETVATVAKPTSASPQAKTHAPKNGRRSNGSRSATEKGLSVERVFAAKAGAPFDGIEWDLRTASITDDKGKVIFNQENVEVPKTWSVLATNIVASKYFYGGAKATKRETSVRQLVHRVARAIADAGLREGYFATPADAENFYTDLAWMCIHQHGSFNSPVWFNVGLHESYGVSSESRSSYYWNSESGRIESSKDNYKHPQASACFIQSVKDTMEDIMRLAAAEAMLLRPALSTWYCAMASPRRPAASRASPKRPRLRKAMARSCAIQARDAAEAPSARR